VNLRLNGEKLSLDVPPNEVLLDTLRERVGLTGTKDVCRSGDCGACTIILNGEAIHSCLTFTSETDGSEVVTVEGLENNGELDPVQTAFLEEEATHCGYCTPGTIMSAKALLLENPKPTVAEIKEALEGNLCRCGTYYSSIAAVQKASRTLTNERTQARKRP
jgi:carbon-monoxide dehydrogenase small subunit